MGQPGLWVENARLGRNRGGAGEYGGGGEAVARGWMKPSSTARRLPVSGGQAPRCPPYGSDVRRGTLLLGEDLAAKPSFVPRGIPTEQSPTHHRGRFYGAAQHLTG